MDHLIDVPSGLHGVSVADTTIGTVDGDAGTYHYRGHDAVGLARRHDLEEVWHLLEVGHLPSEAEATAHRTRLAAERAVPAALHRLVDEVAAGDAPPLDRLRTVLSAAGPALGLTPLLDTAPGERVQQARALAAVVPGIVGRLHRRSLGLDPVEDDPGLGHTAAYLRAVTGSTPTPVAARALEQYLILTIDHGLNASTFTARVVASTGADPAGAVVAALGALAGPLHGGAPSRALDALDAIGAPERAADWVRHEVAAGRRIMGFGHAVYRAPDPRSTLLRDVAERLGGPLVERAVAVETEILATLAELKPDRPLPSNVEYYAGVVMASVGLSPALFTPTFAVSRVVGWVTHAVEQAATGKLIRPAARYVGPQPERSGAASGPLSS